jgi:hypothetical protein
MTVFVTGASGLIGRHLCRVLVRRGNKVVAVSRSPQAAQQGVAWHVGDVTDPRFLAGPMAECSAIINLAGAPIAQRWTAAHRQTIVASRVATTEALVACLQQLRSQNQGPQVLLSTSAVGYYGFDNPGPCDEVAPVGSGLLADTCRAWEAAVSPAQTLGVRCVRLRLGVVLAREGGALPQLVRPIRLGVGAALGSGAQWMSWVHIDDVVGLYVHALDHSTVAGAVNVVAPQSVQHGRFIEAAAQALHRPLWAPRVPAWAVRMALGSMADEVLLGGQRVLPRRAQQTGYAFAQPQLEAALSDLLAT